MAHDSGSEQHEQMPLSHFGRSSEASFFFFSTFSNSSIVFTQPGGGAGCMLSSSGCRASGRLTYTLRPGACVVPLRRGLATPHHVRRALPSGFPLLQPPVCPLSIVRKDGRLIQRVHELSPR